MPASVQRRNGGLRWQALADWEPLLFGPEGLRLDAWRAEGRAQVVKQGAHRIVYRVALSERTFYVKHNRRKRLVDAAGHLVRASAARREWQKAVEVARRGIATVTPVAWAEQVRVGIVRDSYLVTEAVEPSCSLERYVLDELPRLPPELRPEVRRRILESLARFVASIHQAGIDHNDFHVGNLLLQLDTLRPGAPAREGIPELCLIDVPGVRFSGPLKWPASRKSLIMLNAGGWHRTSRTERLRFWKTYLRGRPDLEVPEMRSAITELERHTREYSRRVARRRDSRALRANRDFLALELPGRESHGACDLSQAELHRLLEDGEGLLQRNLDRPVKLDHTTLIVEAELQLAGGPAHVAYKRYRPRSLWKAALGAFRRSRGLRAWRLGHALITRQIATARPLAVCDVRRPWHRRRSYLATEWIEGAENLHLYGWRLARQGESDRLRRAGRCAESLGKLIGRMHAWQVRHRDLKAANLLVVEHGAEVRTYLIDVEDVCIARRLSLSRRAADLARLAVSITAHPWVTRTIVCRFFNAYVGQFSPESVSWKPLWREVARRSERIVRRKQRRGQEVL